MPLQSWLAVFTITFGLALTRLDKRKFDDTQSSSQTSIGFFITLLGTAIFAAVYSLNDSLLSSRSSKTPPRYLSYF